MKSTGRMEKWAVAVLGALSLVLIVNLVVQYNQVRAGARRRAAVIPAKPVLRGSGGAGTGPSHSKAGAPARAKAAAGKQKLTEELSRYNSLVKLDLLKEFEARPLPELKRNPFEFVTVPTQVSRVQTAGEAPGPAQPPAPPPVTLKVMGYSEGAGGVKEAMVSDEDQVFVVHAGDSVGARYKVIKITPTAVTVEDATLHQTVDLPVPP
jgi:Tfp pilus assembly protein PilP